MHHSLDFEGSETAVERSESQACQDLFVLAATGGQKNGYFLEVGASDGKSLSNSYMLEKYFGWRGVSLDIDLKSKLSFMRRLRKSRFVLGDALQTDYQRFVEVGDLPQVVDYLSIDIEPMTNTLAALKAVLKTTLRFRVITYETDWYDPDMPRAVSDAVRAESRELLQNAGYLAVAKDVCASAEHDPFEDWWVDATLIDASRLETMLTVFRDGRTGRQLLGLER